MELILTYGSHDFELDLSRCLVFGYPASHIIAQSDALCGEVAAISSHQGIQEVAR
jgi:hypothetical protein